MTWGQSCARENHFDLFANSASARQSIHQQKQLLHA